MTLKQPTSVDECVYFTRRMSGTSKIKLWVFRELCPQCKQDLMRKPHNPKTGKPKIRAKEYVCPRCKYTIEQKVYEDTLTANIDYVCNYCGYKGELQIPFKRKKIQIFDENEQRKKTVDALRFICSKCNKSIDVTKKMK